MKRLTRMILMLTLAALLPAFSALAGTVTFDLEPLYQVYGAGAGQAPGDFMFHEDGTDLYVNEFFSGGTPYFHDAVIDPAFTGPSIWFGTSQILRIANVGVLFALPTTGDVVFEYLDLGGAVNLQVNGYGTVLEAPDLASLAGTVAPGVTMNVTTAAVGGGIRGTVTLTGPVDKVRLGGQEFWIDNLRGRDGEQPGDCDFEVTHQTQPVGAAWGNPDGNAPGDHLFTEDGIPVTIDVIDWGTGTGFNTCEIMVPGIAGFGFDRVMNLNNVANVYDFMPLGVAINQVTFEYADLGGIENLQVNAGPLHIGDLDAMPAAVAPGVTMSVVTTAVGGGLRGEVTLTGPIERLRVAGQEFFIDNVCAYQGEPDPGCEILSDNESLPAGLNWGSAYGNFPGEHIFTEADIKVLLAEFDYGSGMAFNQASTGAPWGPLGDGNVLHLNNICVDYDLGAHAPVAAVEQEFCKGGGLENLGVNGMLYVGPIESIPAGFFPGFTVTVTATPGPGYLTGLVRIEGDVQQMRIGGQEFYVDNLCVYRDVSPVPEMMEARVALGRNYPNPFNPSTTVAFSLARAGHVSMRVLDVRGLRVATLLNEHRPAGEQAVVWNGQDESGRQAASGMYFVVLESGEQRAVRKIAMVK